MHEQVPNRDRPLQVLQLQAVWRFSTGADAVASVVQGLERSGRIIASAAAIVVLVSLSFVAADIVLIEALELGTAIAVFLELNESLAGSVVCPDWRPAGHTSPRQTETWSEPRL